MIDIRTRKFLASLGVTDLEAFDIHIIDAVPTPDGGAILRVKKDTPWQLEALNEFTSYLNNAKYPVSITFSYGVQPSFTDVSNLLCDFCYANTFQKPVFEIEENPDNHILLIYPSQEVWEHNRTTFKDICDLISFVCYNYVLERGVVVEKVPAEEEAADEEFLQPEEEPQNDDYEEDFSDDDFSSIRQEHEREMLEAQNSMLNQIKKEQEDALRHEEAKAKYEIGNYRKINKIEEAYHVGQINIEIEGTVYEWDIRITNQGNTRFRGVLGDKEDGIYFSGTLDKRGNRNEIISSIRYGSHIRLRGHLYLDKFYGGQLSINVHFTEILPPLPTRGDPETEKRVELHLHTKMSTLDGASDIDEYCRIAKGMGMKAIGLTDHATVQSFPKAQEAAKANGLKMIYGTELYMYDSNLHMATNPINTPLDKARYCVFDTETTGLSSRYDRIIEFGAVLVDNGVVVDQFQTFINPGIHIPEASSSVNHITDDMVKDAPSIEEVMPKILEFMGDRILVAHNAVFDVGYMNAALKRMGLPPLSNPIIDTIPLSHYLFPDASSHNEGAFLKHLGVYSYSNSQAHRAAYDAEVLNEGFQVAIGKLSAEHPGITHEDLTKLSIPEDHPFFHRFISYLKEKHICVLVKNKQGLKDLYRIISLSSTTYFSPVTIHMPGIPKTPRDLIEKYRENLLLGSACFNGEIFEAASHQTEEELKKAISFYDYIEIQPLENYSYLLNMHTISSEEHLIEILKDIVKAAREVGVPIVATGDVHYADPDDKIIRDVYISQKTKGGGSHVLNPSNRAKLEPFENPDQHFRSTREMLDSFEKWCCKEDAHEFVITNSNLIADQIEDDLVIVTDETYTPNENLPNSEKLIRELVEQNFRDRYEGCEDEFSLQCVQQAKDRMEKELSGIINNGYAVTYKIAHDIIEKASNEPEHYIVGSRGSVGSSFAAYLADITEVNPLPPHYLCPKCHYMEWGNPGGQLKYRSGVDLPEKECPHCHTPMNRDGQNIPFETFLGFEAEKVPDIDLNFEDESQKKAFEYTRELLGAEYVFRAGTIETVAEKTAFGYARGEIERKGEDPNKEHSATLAMTAARCSGAKKTTGQHPGGVIVVPKGMDVFDFTPYQYPGDDLDSDWYTTHFDYRSMHDEILKLDLLGHIDPLAMRRYRDLCSKPGEELDIKKIPISDPKVLGLFGKDGSKLLGLKENHLEQKSGVLALPEFGTVLGQELCVSTNPKSFDDLIILSGLAHGQGVWGGNAQDLIKSNRASLREVIGCRDDIMTYLQNKGISNHEAFSIMESVRKGKGLKENQVALLRAHNVPEFYIDSCQKIKYLFPRAHATAYVTMAARVAWFKIYKPLEFYSVYFSYRSRDWDIKSLIKGEKATIELYDELKTRRTRKDPTWKDKDDDIMDTAEVAIEMFERGYHFQPIDLYKSQAREFGIDYDNKSLIPPFYVVPGLGEGTADTIVKARSNGVPFLSKEDLLERTSLNSANLTVLEELGVLDGLSETNQMSLF